jgi:hypothetical protein
LRATSATRIHPERERVLHHDCVDVGQVGGRPGAERAADEVDLLGNLLRAPRGRALIEQVRHQLGDPTLAARILSRASARQEHAS